MKGSVSSLMTAEEIKLASDQQEEQDRQQVALYGIPKNENMKVLGLKDECLSCNGQINFIKNAFKMACVYYKPGKILYSDQTYTREDLIKKREKMLFEQLGKLKIQKKYHNVQKLGEPDLAHEENVSIISNSGMGPRLDQSISNEDKISIKVISNRLKLVQQAKLKQRNLDQS